ncbi:MAG: polyprenyl synthetase family protein [Thermodesulfovibrionales bacterium]|nr:polyprenyl synthetase family protein [Thermodesulfovibrionales bacterium]MDP3111335.1 polyprenyl synthetase family protein [Thermodesulfovibrionales bacterium]
MDIKQYLKDKKELIDSFLKEYFSSPSTPSILGESVTYSLFAGGKRIRPILCLAAYEACDGDSEDILPFASSIELIHTYSLIHDDLPAMDNDDLRRGKPTNHKVFGEGMAILAGDGLLTEAFYMMSNSLSNKNIKNTALIRAIKEISFVSGIHGMVGGQAQDLLSEDAEPDKETLSFIHKHKTGALISGSLRAGAILANCTKPSLSAITRYGENIGLAFQVIDDILDIEGNTAELGKTAGSDERKKKMTYPAFYGIEQSRGKAGELISEAIFAIKDFSGKAEPLREIARYFLERRN